MLKIDVIFGGRSYEHEISIVSAVALKKVLESSQKISIDKFIFLDASHELYLVPHDKMKSKTFSSGEYKSFKKIYLNNFGFSTKAGIFAKEKKLDLNIALSLIHGGDGEDGIFSNTLEFYNIPFIAPRGNACVFSFDKEYSKIYAKSKGVNVLEYETLDKKHLISKLDFPKIYKPSRLGSSLGISIAHDSKEEIYAKDTAFEYDNKILVEPFINKIKEYNLAGVKIGDKYVFSMVEEPNKKELLGFEDKYLDFNRTAAITKADIDESLESALQDSFKKIYEDCFEGAIIRCDFFVLENKVYLNEINPIPGSLANYLFENFDEVLCNLAENLPRKKHIPISYKYIEQIHHAKGK